MQQGVDVPDCRLQAALASLAQADPEAITKMIKDNHDGTYTVTFPGDKDHPQTISAPTDWERSTFSKGGNDGQWALIIDKAYRQKIGQPFGPYGAAPDIEGLLTGQEHSFLYMDPDGLCNPLFRGFDWLASKLGAQSVCANNTPDIPLPQLVERNNDGAIFEDPAKVGEILQDALKNHMLITTGFKAEETKAADKVNYGTDKNGDHVEIESGHAYTVTAYDPVKQTVTLRNPWGTNIDARFPILEGDGYVTMPVDQFRRMILGLQVERTSRSPK